MKTIEFHILQNFPPSNLNRDDSGAPKDCDFGGYRRQRISSQCLKRSVRQSDIFQQLMADRLGIRTKRAPEQVAKQLMAGGYEQAAAQAAAEAFFDALHGVKDKGQTDYLLYIGQEELVRTTNLLLNAGPELHSAAQQLAGLRTELVELSKKEKDSRQKDSEKVTKVFAELAQKYKDQFPGHTRAVDVALFGRMLAKSPKENIDAACQVSHALSVNRLNMEFDYFTAIDDIPSEDNNAGASMIGTVGFASSCFYRFACVNVDQLSRNLGGDTAAAHEGVLAFAEAFVQARPSGKQNTFAAHSLPAFIMVVARETGQPVSLVNAFEVPVRPTDGAGLTAGAIQALGRHYAQLHTMYGLQGEAVYATAEAANAELQEAGVARQANVPALLAFLRTALTAVPA